MAVKNKMKEIVEDLEFQENVKRLPESKGVQSKEEIFSAVEKLMGKSRVRKRGFKRNFRD